METYTELKSFIDNPKFVKQRKQNLKHLNLDKIDPPIAPLIQGFAQLPYCFTLQSCYGHFLYTDQNDTQNVDPLPITDTITEVDYRIAYIALVIQHSDSGKKLFEELRKIKLIEPEYIQFGCADWFWERNVNSYVLQIEPDCHKYKDRVILPYKEASKIEKVRNQFFDALNDFILRKLFHQ